MNKNSHAPKGVDSAYVTMKDGVWVGMRTDETLVHSAVTGIAIAIGIGFIVINLVTGNLFISLLAIIHIGG